jgi:hypothetical protein
MRRFVPAVVVCSALLVLALPGIAAPGDPGTSAYLPMVVSQPTPTPLPPTPTPVPPAPAPPVYTLTNGNFEAGSAVWVEASLQGQDIITNQPPSSNQCC